MNKIEIDASAGGQVFRTALGLSSVLKKPVRIKKIRLLKPNPGLRAQHLTVLKTMKAVCNAKIKGGFLDSTEVEFLPEHPMPCSLNVNIGTAGSISLLIQACLFPALFSKISLKITGGTDVKWSPPFNFMKEELFPTLKKTGACFEAELLSRGYFPKGNGRVLFSSSGSKFPLKPVSLTSFSQIRLIKLFSHCSRLPKEVVLNQASAAKKALEGLNVEIAEKTSVSQNSSIGSGIELFAFDSNNAIIGANALGEKGKPATLVGKQAAQNLLQELLPKNAVDSHLADQLVPFMALAKGKSTIHCSKITTHLLDIISLTESFIECNFDVEGKKGSAGKISVQGIGFSNA
jgi:RNA 3'-terminal phosphate cyclase (GTP)